MFFLKGCLDSYSDGTHLLQRSPFSTNFHFWVDLFNRTQNLFYFVLKGVNIFILKSILVFLPSLHERLKVSVGSISFFILMRASRAIGPHLG